MDLLLSRSLLAVAEHGAISEAAVAIGLSQPALSRRIHQLEEELGGELLRRSGRGVVLTELGRLAVAEGGVLVERYERLKRDIAQHRDLEAGSVRIGGGATAVSQLLPRAIAAFLRSHPQVRFEVREEGSRDVESSVLDERVELGIVTLPLHAGGLSVGRRFRDRIVLVAGRGHALAGCGRAGRADIEGESIVAFEAGSAIRRIIDGALAEAEIRVNVMMELRNIPAMLQMVDATGSLAFVSERCVPKSRAIRVRGLGISRELGLVWKRERDRSPAARAFSEELGKT